MDIIMYLPASVFSSMVRSVGDEVPDPVSMLASRENLYGDATTTIDELLFDFRDDTGFTFILATT